MNPFKDAAVCFRLFLGVLHNSLATSAWRIKMLQTQKRDARIKSHIMWPRGTSARRFWPGMGDCSLTEVLYSGCSSICWGGDGRRQGVRVMQSVWGCTSQGGRKAALAPVVPRSRAANEDRGYFQADFHSESDGMEKKESGTQEADGVVMEIQAGLQLAPTAF